MKKKLLYTYTVTGNPTTKKNSQQILYNRATGRRFVSSSKQYKDFEGRVKKQVKPEHEPINYPIEMKCLFYMKTKRRCDLTNLLEAIDDAFVRAGVLEDDNFNIIVSHDGSRVLYDKENPRTEIYIYEE